eukprot:CAMPEP_0173390676 /NCGR_PEP_ID=MMETSP1356-20130122/15783_1 /TAXON_ID=77927 ORGANISM="Hemiselmis virescens, Strain PCC157" /NCGR_SAMPLE_ID=MMETSP1356 /ASSEMBLY_ACC=CAM_ASM_000847 /LENGTH=321 /DNA_ID=CAMNT_0014348127 /DNA_START=242 /DNA_END=1203 /DNA_ORIENTATION=-
MSTRAFSARSSAVEMREHNPPAAVNSPLLRENSMYKGTNVTFVNAMQKARRRQGTEPGSRSCNCCCFVCADQSVKVIVQNFGRLDSIRDAGLHLLRWPFQTAALVSLKVRIMDVTTNSKTLDNVTVKVRSSVQYQVEADRVDEYLFRLNDPATQIASFVEDGIRSMLPTLTVDAAFGAKGDIGDAVCRYAEKEMGQYGVTILAVLVCELQIAPEVSAAMNSIEASRLAREAAIFDAEARKIKVIKAAEADADAKHLLGVGVARQRLAMCDGIQKSILRMRETNQMVDQREVLYMTLTTQYLDVVSDFAKHAPSSLLTPPPP